MSEPHPSRPARPDPFGQPAAPRSGQRYRFRTVALHLDPHRAPRRYRIGPAGRPPLEVAIVPRWVRLAKAGHETLWFGLIYLAGGLPYLWWGHLGLVDLATVLAACVGLTFLWRYAVSGVPAPVVAGSDWVGSGRGRKSTWVPLYEIIRIDSGQELDEPDGDPIPDSIALTLSGGPGQGVYLPLKMLQANPELWDLVYQGIIHSLAASAPLSPDTRQVLRL